MDLADLTRDLEALQAEALATATSAPDVATLEAHRDIGDRGDRLLLPSDDEPLADAIDDEGGRAGGPDVGGTGCRAILQFGTQGGCHGVTPGDRGGDVVRT